MVTSQTAGHGILASGLVHITKVIEGTALQHLGGKTEDIISAN